ncbi:MAG: bifunctional UDP-N-acetylglucosamine pyrophosphorylase / glucosamine-phosphate N-acetyltransferase [Streptosporangiaceae bacterium]|nr:bifunctional UDP-N-acetylglucosamine pyrophosphorylase / glucosamine-phosphate N-acetyltransferase [Streptosporangiaceae bacterium]
MSVSRPAAVIILAAGEGTRMKSDTPKVLHQICGQTLLGHVLATARETDPVRLIVVVGHRRRQVTEYLASHAPDVQAVVQHRQGGTGHAVRTVIEEVGLDHGTIVVTYADAPLLRGVTLAALVREHQAREASASVLTARVSNPTGYGRIIRDDSGAFLKIIEEADASPGQRAVDEINSGVYAFEAHLLGDAVKRVPTDNAKGEEYLTDVIAILRAEGHHVASVTLDDPDEVLGVNDRAQLARARQIFNARLLDTWMGAGVTIVDPATTWIDTGVSLGRDVEIGPGTQLEGRTEVAAGARVGPGSQLRDTTVGEGASVIQSVCREADIGAGAVVGPFAYLPPGSKVDAGGPAEGMNESGIGAGGQMTGTGRDPAHQDPGGQGPGGQGFQGQGFQGQGFRAQGAGERHAGGQDAATSEGAQGA